MVKFAGINALVVKDLYGLCTREGVSIDRLWGEPVCISWGNGGWEGNLQLALQCCA